MDLISRQDAIDVTWIEPSYSDSLNVLTEVRNRIEALPSAEPEEFEWCHDCKEYDQNAHCCHRWTKVIRNTVEELKAQRKGKWIEDARTYYETLNERGYFVDQHTEYFVDDIACSECLKRFSTIDNETERFDFCPNCGADMRGKEDG